MAAKPKSKRKRLLCFVPGCRAEREADEFTCADHAKHFAPAATAYEKYLDAMHKCLAEYRDKHERRTA